MSKLRRLADDSRFNDLLAAAVGIGLIAATFVLPGGQDMHLVYRRIAEGCLTCGYAPWHAQMLYAPLALIPPVLLWPVTVALSIAGVFWAAKRLETPPAIVLSAFPMLAYVWLGQMDVFIVVGLTLLLLAESPYLRGVGIVLASIKPQVSGLAILLLLIRDREWFKTLIIPAFFFGLSLLIYGPDWPVRWLRHIFENPLPHVWARGVIFPWGLLAFPLMLLFRDKRSQLTVLLLATALGIPRVGIYSHITYLALFAPWWTVPASYVWLVAWPWLGNQALRFSFVLPLAVLIAFTWPAVRERLPFLSSTPGNVT